jgi:hypothetical protein
LCVVIFSSDKEGVPANWATGIDITVTTQFDENGEIDLKDEVSFGKEKYFPSGPTCFFRGKTYLVYHYHPPVDPSQVSYW